MHRTSLILTHQATTYIELIILGDIEAIRPRSLEKFLTYSIATEVLLIGKSQG